MAYRPSKRGYYTPDFGSLDVRVKSGDPEKVRGLVALLGKHYRLVKVSPELANDAMSSGIHVFVVAMPKEGT